MPHVPIIMPQLGESIAEATVIKLLVKPGEPVREDQEVMEVETSKATTTVNSPCAGKIDKITAQMNEAYPAGAQLGFIEVTEAVAAEMGLNSNAPKASDLPEPMNPAHTKPAEKRKVEPTVSGLPVPLNSGGA